MYVQYCSSVTDVYVIFSNPWVASFGSMPMPSYCGRYAAFMSQPGLCTIPTVLFDWRLRGGGCAACAVEAVGFPGRVSSAHAAAKHQFGLSRDIRWSIGVVLHWPCFQRYMGVCITIAVALMCCLWLCGHLNDKMRCPSCPRACCGGSGLMVVSCLFGSILLPTSRQAG